MSISVWTLSQRKWECLWIMRIIRSLFIMLNPHNSFIATLTAPSKRNSALSSAPGLFMVAKTPLRSSSVLSTATVRSDQSSLQLRETRHRVVSFSTFIYLSPLSGHLKTKGPDDCDRLITPNPQPTFEWFTVNPMGVFRG